MVPDPIDRTQSECHLWISLFSWRFLSIKPSAMSFLYAINSLPLMILSYSKMWEEKSEMLKTGEFGVVSETESTKMNFFSYLFVILK